MSRCTLIAALVMSVVCFSPIMAAQQDDQFALLMQKSPRYGGIVTPVSGVQMAGPYQLVEISATPRQGFEFLYWLGDVTEPTNSSTTVLLDSPKLVIAIFERSELVPLESAGVAGVSGGGAFSAGNLTPNPVSYPKAFSSASPSSPPSKSPPTTYIFTPDDDPPAVPEPATIALLAAGSLILLKRKRS